MYCMLDVLVVVCTGVAETCNSDVTQNTKQTGGCWWLSGLLMRLQEQSYGMD